MTENRHYCSVWEVCNSSLPSASSSITKFLPWVLALTSLCDGLKVVKRHNPDSRLLTVMVFIAALEK